MYSDRVKFSKKDSTIYSNVSQIVKSTNEYVKPSDKLLDAAGVDDLSNTDLSIDFVANDGSSGTATIDLGGSPQVSVKDLAGNIIAGFNIYDSSGNATDANSITYQQLSDVVSMIVSNNLPADNKASYDAAIEDAKKEVNVYFDYRGRLTIEDKTNSSSAIEFAMYDSSVNDFSGTSGGAALSFASNNAITTDEPHVDFFKELDMMIDAVRNGLYRADADSGDPRNIGIQNSISKIDHIADHTAKLHTKIGSLSNALDNANQRAQLLSLNVAVIRSEVADTDIGEAMMKFEQVSVNYQATLSTVSKINSLSLLNYI